jgi:hypothetical protein
MRFGTANLLRVFVTTALAMFSGRPLGADETTLCNSYITSIPYTITKQGHYCLDRNITTTYSDSLGAAITIDSDYVVLDFNGFKLEGPPFIGAQLPTAVRSRGHKNITVRNAIIRHFSIAISVVHETTDAGGHVIIENNSLDQNEEGSIHVLDYPFAVSPLSIVVRNNVITRLSGSGIVSAIFVSQSSGGLATIANNVIAGVTNTTEFDYPAVGIYAGCNGSYSIDHNVVANLNGPSTYGVFHDPDCTIGTAVCRDNTVLGPTTAAYFDCTLVGDNYPLSP